MEREIELDSEEDFDDYWDDLNQNLSELTNDVIDEMSVDQLLFWCHSFNLLDIDADGDWTPSNVNAQDLRDLVVSCRNDLHADNSSCSSSESSDYTFQKYTKEEIDKRCAIILTQLHYRDLRPTKRGGGKLSQVFRTLSHESSTGQTPPFAEEFRATKANTKRLKYVLLIMMDLYHVNNTIALRDMEYKFGSAFKMASSKKDFMGMKAARYALGRVVIELSHLLGFPRLLLPIDVEEKFVIFGHLTVKRGDVVVDLSKRYNKFMFDQKAIVNTLFMKSPDMESYYTINDIKDVRGIICFEKEHMMWDTYENMNDDQKRKYVLIGIKGIRSRNCLYGRRLVHELAKQSNIDLTQNDFVVGDCDVGFLNIALMMEHIDYCPPAERSLHIRTTFVGPKPSDNNEEHFMLFTEDYKGRVGKLPSKYQMSQLRRWCGEESSMLNNQFDERLGIITSFIDGERMFRYSDYDKVEWASFIINDIESRFI